MSQFIVYRIAGKLSGDAYYGYCKDEDPKASFLKGASRTEESRVDVKFLMANGDDPDNITAEILDVANDEIEAWATRNDYRATMIDTVSGPTMWPGRIAERVAKEQPDRVAKWKKSMQMRDARTAREAWNLGMWTQDTIKELATRYPIQQIVTDLDKLKPLQFAVKYSLQHSG